MPNLFIAGGAIAGRNTGNIFIENGRFHGERIIRVLAERFHGLTGFDGVDGATVRRCDVCDGATVRRCDGARVAVQASRTVRTT